MSKLFKGSVFVLLFFWAVSMPGISSAQDEQNLNAEGTDVATLQDAAAVEAYWTDARMEAAVPLDLAVVQDPQALETDISSLLPTGPPSFIPPWNGKGPQPDSELIELDMATAALDTSPPFSPPANPVDYQNYAPFQRFNFPGSYTRYPRSTVGKLYFRMDANGDGVLDPGQYYCTASVVGAKDLIFTAGHCVNNGLNGRGYNRGFSVSELFCPSWDNGTLWQGCWAADLSSIVSLEWFQRQATDRDYACLVTRTTGSKYNTSVGNVTGWTGMAFNQPDRNLVIAWGYPSMAPFTGAKIINSVSTEWYLVNMTSGDGNYSKYIGNDQHSGNSGGPWWVNYVHPALNYADTDGSHWTNPFQGAGRSGPYLVGVNSHMRCRTNCRVPPTSTAGAFWQEEGSPQITRSTSDPSDAYDIWQWCFDNGGS